MTRFAACMLLVLAFYACSDAQARRSPRPRATVATTNLTVRWRPISTSESWIDGTVTDLACADPGLYEVEREGHIYCISLPEHPYCVDGVISQLRTDPVTNKDLRRLRSHLLDTASTAGLDHDARFAGDLEVHTGAPRHPYVIADIHGAYSASGYTDHCGRVPWSRHMGVALLAGVARNTYRIVLVEQQDRDATKIGSPKRAVTRRPPSGITGSTETA